MSHFDEMNIESNREGSKEQPIDKVEREEMLTEFVDLDTVMPEQEPPAEPVSEAQNTAEAPQPQQNPDHRQQAAPPPTPPYPPQGWTCGTPFYMQQEAERRERLNLKRLIKSDANKAIGLVLIFVAGMQMLASMAVLIYEAIAAITGYGLSEPVYDFFFSYFPVIVCESLALILGLCWFKTDVKQLFRKPTLKKGEGYKGVLYTGFSLGFIQVGALIYMAIYYLLYAIGIEIYIPEITADTSNVVINVLSFVYIVVVGPLLEEIFFRGILFQKLRKYGDVPTILITAILFALFHCNFVQLMGPLFFGVAIGIVASKTNSLWLCWLIHTLNNLIATVYDYLPESAGNVYDTVVTFGLIAVGVVCAILLRKELGDVIKNRRGNCTVLSAKAKFGCMVNNACFYIFAVIWLALSLLVQISGSFA